MLTPRSIERMTGVHPDLVRVVLKAAERGGRFQVTEGLRTPQRQAELYAGGKSKTLKSRHLTGHAVDVVAMHDDGSISYDWPDMLRVAEAMKAAAADVGVPVEWGGDWKSFKDTPHFQLPVAQYPADGPTIEAKAARVETVEPKPAAAAPAEAPAARVAEAAVKSRTIWGALAAFVGWLMQQLEGAVQIVLDGIAEVSKLGPIKEVTPHVKSLGVGLTVFGLVVVIWRRLDAAAKGKIG